MIICNGKKIHDLDYNVTQHWIHLKVITLSSICRTLDTNRYAIEK